MTDKRSTKDLFKAWRSGDGAAGQLMAQRVADWYYAIAVSRLGEARGSGPCDTACARFGDGIVQVSESRALVQWAHDIILSEVSRGGGVARDGDEPNAYTNKKSPKSLLARAREAMPTEIGLMEKVYGGEANENDVDPIEVLTARYSVKRWLHANAGVPFAVVPVEPILDRAPLPQYESAHMSEDVAASFEQWMLSDYDLCRDIAEFATYAVALRGGIGNARPASAGRTASRPAAAASGSSSVPAATREAAPSSSTGQNATKGIVIAVGALAVIVLLLAIGAALFTMML